ncbi:MAG: hypothetical protein COT85_06875 [Chlamydiae bacterium CG10_big_fil_rev_8_21_14_0_10_42_34]|nr:MAG: hypothetical protein COT85_06875 [Chlamydiae bacterium CG10_big_fil_rev_8_21_14_0_10_42_34]
MRKVCSIFVLAISPLLALPTGFQGSDGNVNVSTVDDGHLLIKSLERGSANWDSFSIGPDEHVIFEQAGINSSFINRVIGNEGSELLGRLSSNGSVYLINPNGILIGPHAEIEAASFIGSTLDLLTQDYLDERALHFQGNSEGGVVNQGKVCCKNGNIFLIGRTVENSGELFASRVGLVSGSVVLIEPKGENRIYIRAALTKDLVQEIQDGSPYGKAIRHDGMIEAFAIEERGGEIYLVAADGSCEVEGDLFARNESGIGGSVHVLGDEVHLVDTAKIDVCGKNGGGTVLIGGDFQGNNSRVKNSQRTCVDQGVMILADAIDHGDGGKVIVWADNQTVCHGKISARGGFFGGDGGFVEVSGKTLDFQGIVDRRAPFGVAGTLLLDPINLIISDRDSENVINPNGMGAYAFRSNAPTTISAAILGENLNCGDVVIDTKSFSSWITSDAGTITINSPIVWSAPSQLHLIAEGNLTVNAQITSRSEETGFDAIFLQSNGTAKGAYKGIHVESCLATMGGNIILQGNSYDGAGVVVNAPIVSKLGNITFQQCHGGNGSSGNNYGVLVNVVGGAKVQTNEGEILFDHIYGGSSGSNNYGVFVLGKVDAPIISATNVYGGNGVNGNHGFYIQGGPFGSNSNRSISLQAKGGAGTSSLSNNCGIMFDFGTIQTGDKGTIHLFGTGGGNAASKGLNNHGINLIGGNVSAGVDLHSNAAIILEGFGGVGSDGGHIGVVMNGSEIAIRGKGDDGLALGVTGTGGDGGSGNTGILSLGGPIRVLAEAKDVAKVIFKGIGGTGEGGNHCGVICASQSIHHDGNGAFSFAGCRGGSGGSGNQGVVVRSNIDRTKSMNPGPEASIIFEDIEGGSGEGSHCGVVITHSGNLSAPHIVALNVSGGKGKDKNYGFHIDAGTVGSKIFNQSISLQAKGGSAEGSQSDNVGILLTQGVLQTSEGVIVLNGTGGGSADGKGFNNSGIRLSSGALIAGSAELVGIGGAGEEGSHIGIHFAGAEIVANGAITIDGLGGSSMKQNVVETNNHGVFVSNGAVSAKVIDVIRAQGGSGTSRNSGFLITKGTFGSSLDFYDTVITISANGGSGSFAMDSNYGVSLEGGAIQTGDQGSITVHGTGGGIATNKGSNNCGILLKSGVLKAGKRGDSTAAIELVGVGGFGQAGSHAGVNFAGSEIAVKGVSGLLIDGVGGSSGSGTDNHGVFVSKGVVLAKEITVQRAQGGIGSSRNHGFYLSDGTFGSSSDFCSSAISITATGGVGSSENHGIVATGGKIAIGDQGCITFYGTGGGIAEEKGSRNCGIVLGKTNVVAGRSKDSDAKITFSGNGGLGVEGDHYGVHFSNFTLDHSGNGAFTVTNCDGMVLVEGDIDRSNSSFPGKNSSIHFTHIRGGLQIHSGTIDANQIAGVDIEGELFGVMMTGGTMGSSSSNPMIELSAKGNKGKGIYLTGGEILSGDARHTGGSIRLKGIGGVSHGIHIEDGTLQTGTDHSTVVLTGIGGACEKGDSFGVYLSGGTYLYHGSNYFKFSDCQGGKGPASATGVYIDGPSICLSEPSAKLLFNQISGGFGKTNCHGVQLVSGSISAPTIYATNVFGGVGTSKHHGFYINGASVEAKDLISIQGKGGNGSDAHSISCGIVMDKGSLCVLDTKGIIYLNGIGGKDPSSSGANNHGIYLAGGRLTAGMDESSTATVILNGIGGAGTSGRHYGVAFEDAEVTVNGTGKNGSTLSIYGTGGSLGAQNHGIFTSGGSIHIAATENSLSNVLLTGIGGSGVGGSHCGVYSEKTFVFHSGNGAFSFTECRGGSGGAKNSGVYLNSSIDRTKSPLSGKQASILFDQIVAGSTGSDNYGVIICSESVLKAPTISAIEVYSGAGTDRNYGFYINGGKLITSSHLSIEAKAGGVGSENHGIFLDADAKVTNRLGGQVSLYGVSSNLSTNESHGVFVKNATIDSPEDGNVFITGAVPKGASGSSVGILFEKAPSAVVSNEGEITLSGTSLATGDRSFGVSIESDWDALTSGDVRFSKCSGGSGFASHGVHLGASFSTDGNIICNAIESGVGEGSVGFYQGADFTTRGTGKSILVDARSMAEKGAAHGIVIAKGAMSTIDGPIVLNGISGESDGASFGIHLSAPNPIFSHTGSIKLCGKSYATKELSHGVSITADWKPKTLGNVVFSECGGGKGDESHGLHVAAMFAASKNVSVNVYGGDGEKSAGFCLNDAPFTSEDGDISIEGSSEKGFGAFLSGKACKIETKGQISFQTKEKSIAIADALISSGGGDIHFFSPVQLLANMVTISTDENGSIFFDRDLNAIDASLSVNVDLGTLHFAHPIGEKGVLNTLSISSNGDVRTDAIAAQRLLQEGSSRSEFGGKIDVSGDKGIFITANSVAIGSDMVAPTGPIYFASDVELVGDVFLKSNEGGVTFANRVDGAHHLKISSGKGDVVCNANIGDVSPLESLVITPDCARVFIGKAVTQIKANSMHVAELVPTVLSNFERLSIYADKEGSIAFGGTLQGVSGLSLITDLGSITLSKAVERLDGELTLVSNNSIQTSEITAKQLIQKGIGSSAYFGKISVSSLEGISLSGSDITLHAPITSEGAVTIDHSGSLTILQKLNVNASFDQTGLGSVSIAKGIDAKGLHFSGDVELVEELTLNASKGDIHFNRTINGPHYLNLNAKSGVVALDANVGEIAPLKGLFIADSCGRFHVGEAVTHIGVNSLTVSGSVPSHFYNTAPLTVDLGRDGSALFGGNIEGAEGLHLLADQGSITFAGPKVQMPGSLSLSSNGLIYCKDIHASSLAQTGTASSTYDGKIFANEIHLSGSTIVMNEAVITKGKGSVTIENLEALTILADMDLSGEFTQKGAGPVFIGAQLKTDDHAVYFSGNIQLLSSVHFDSGSADITFNSPVNGTNIGAETLRLKSAGGKITFNGNVGSTTVLKEIVIDEGAHSLCVGKSVQHIQAKSFLVKGFVPTILNNMDTLTIDVGQSGSIIFGGVVYGTNAGKQDLTLVTDKGSIHLKGGVKGPLKDLVVVSNQSVRSGGITASTLTQKGAGSGEYKDVITTSGAAGINLSGSKITIKASVATGSNGPFTINHSGDLILTANMFLTGPFVQRGTGTVSIAGMITTTTDSISFASPTVLVGDTSLVSNSGDIAFENTLDGSYNLKVSAGKNVIFSKNLGDTARLGRVTIHPESQKVLIDTEVTSVQASAFTVQGKVPTEMNNVKPLTIDVGSLGSLAFGGTLCTKSDLTLLADSGKIVLEEAVKGSHADLTLVSNHMIQTKAITAQSLTQKGSGSSLYDGKIQTLGSRGISITGSAITLHEMATEDSGPFEINNSGRLTLLGKMELSGSFIQKGLGLTCIGADLTALDHPIHFTGPVSLVQDVALSSGAADIAFANTVDGSYFLKLTSEKSDILFCGNIGAATRLQGLVVAHCNKHLVIGESVSEVQLNSLIVEGDVPSVFKNKGLLTVDAGLVGSLAFGGKIQGADELALTTDQGSITLSDAIDVPKGSLTLTSNCAIHTKLVKACGFTQKGSGDVFIGADITTSDQPIFFSGKLLLDRDLCLQSSGGDISFLNTVDGPYNLELITPKNIVFGADIGRSLPLNDIAVSETCSAVVVGPDVCGIQAHSLAVKGSVPTTINNLTPLLIEASSEGSIAFGGNLFVNKELTLKADEGEIILGSFVDGPLSTLTLISNQKIQTRAITAQSLTQKGSGSGVYDGKIQTLGPQGITLTGSAITLCQGVLTEKEGPLTINNCDLLKISDQSKVELSGTFVQSGSGPVSLGADIIVQKGPISFHSNVRLIADVTLDSKTSNGDIVFNQPVQGPCGMALFSGSGSITFKDQVGVDALLDYLHVQGGFISVNGSHGVQNGPLVYDGPVALQSQGDFLNCGDNGILFKHTITGNFDLACRALGSNVTVLGDIDLSGQKDGGTFYCSAETDACFSQIITKGSANNRRIGIDGGDVVITSTLGSILVQHVDTSGGDGHTTGGNAGSITLQPTSEIQDGIAKGIIQLQKDQTGRGNMIAKGGSGTIKGIGGTVTLSAGRVRAAGVATITSSLEGNDVMIQADRLIMGPYESMTVLGSIDLDLESSAILSDMVATENLTIKAPTIYLQMRKSTPILNNIGGKYLSPMIHFLAGADYKREGMLSPNGPLNEKSLAINPEELEAKLFFESTLLNYDQY